MHYCIPCARHFITAAVLVALALLFTKLKLAIESASSDTVRHKAWGEGVVIQVATAEEVVVRFPGQGEKRLHVAYAPIEKV